MTPEFQTHVLPNGLRIIHAWMPREVTHCALVINAGTRDEGEGEAGLAHFIEHVLFKGTAKRKAFHILNRMESVGGEINAYTTKEDTWITTNLSSAVPRCNFVTQSIIKEITRRHCHQQLEALLDSLVQYYSEHGKDLRQKLILQLQHSFLEHRIVLELNDQNGVE